MCDDDNSPFSSVPSVVTGRVSKSGNVGVLVFASLRGEMNGNAVGRGSIYVG